MLKSTVTTINSDEINVKITKMTSKTQTVGEGNKKCRSFRRCLNLHDYHFKTNSYSYRKNTYEPMKTTNQKPIIDTLKKERNTSMLLKKTIKQQTQVNCRCKEMDVCHTLWHLFTFMPSVKLLIFGRRMHLLECLDTLKYRPFGLDRHLSWGSAENREGSAQTKMIATCRAEHIHSLTVLGASVGRQPCLSGSNWDSALTTGWRGWGFPVQQLCHRTQLSSLSRKISAKHS